MLCCGHGRTNQSEQHDARAQIDEAIEQEDD